MHFTRKLLFGDETQISASALHEENVSINKINLIAIKFRLNFHKFGHSWQLSIKIKERLTLSSDC